jgi:hypothetical protein
MTTRIHFFTSTRVNALQQSYCLLEEDGNLVVLVELDNNGEDPWAGSIEYGLTAFFGEDGDPQKALLALDLPPEFRSQVMEAYGSLSASARRAQNKRA